MERQTIIERSAAAIGQPYTQELHDAWVAHLAEVSRLAEQVAALREREHILSPEARGLLVEMIPPAVATYHHSLIDPEAWEI